MSPAAATPPRPQGVGEGEGEAPGSEEAAEAYESVEALAGGVCV